MIKHSLSLLVLLILTVECKWHAHAGEFDKVIKIIVESRRGKSLGTGFFIDSKGSIITNYHVIERAKKITIRGSFGESENALISGYSEKYDLALLTIPGADFEFFEMGHPTGDLTLLDAKVIGHPNGITNQTFKASITYPQPISSLAINIRGTSIFNENIKLLPISTTIYSGISGSPLIANGKVIGVATGSLNQGGSFAWAIPITYYNELKRVTPPTATASTLPKLSLMKSRWNRSYRALGELPRIVKLSRKNDLILNRTYTYLQEIESRITREIEQIDSNLEFLEGYTFQNNQTYDLGDRMPGPWLQLIEVGGAFDLTSYNKILNYISEQIALLDENISLAESRLKNYKEGRQLLKETNYDKFRSEFMSANNPTRFRIEAEYLIEQLSIDLNLAITRANNIMTNGYRYNKDDKKILMDSYTSIKLYLEFLLVFSDFMQDTLEHFSSADNMLNEVSQLI